MWRYFNIVILCTFLSCSAIAQTLFVHGVLKDKDTEEPIPFGAVQFDGTNIGTSTDEKGVYSFHLDMLPGDSLLARVMGYQVVKKYVSRDSSDQTINFYLERKEYALNEFVVSAGVNLALRILKKIIEHKPENDVRRWADFNYRVYNKMEVDINRLNEDKVRKSKLLKPFAFILDNMDSTSEEKPFLPIFLTETISRYFYQKDPTKRKEIIESSRTSGIKNKSFAQFLGTMYQNVNVYDNFIPVFGENFISPINNSGKSFYDYKLVDTQYIAKRRFFKISFKPKRKGERTFFGDFWVHDTTFAIQKMSMQVAKDANINFVNRVSLLQEYEPVDDSIWFLVKDKFIADFNPIGDKHVGLIGRKTTIYDSIEVNEGLDNPVFQDKKLKGRDIYLLPDAQEKSNQFWQNNRFESLSRNERAIYSMMDTLQQMPVFKTYRSIAEVLATGTKAVGPIEFGPYWNIVSTNDLEKLRLRFDLGTTPDLFKDAFLHGYVAYGFGDKAVKGGFDGLWILNREPRMYVFGSISHDLDIGEVAADEVSFSNDNIFTLAVRKKGIPQKFIMQDEKQIKFYKEWYPGISIATTLRHSRYNPYAPLPLKSDFTDHLKPEAVLNNSEFQLELRFAWEEKFLEGNYYRMSLGSPYPILSIRGAVGLKGFLNGGYRYQKIRADVSNHVDIPPFGKLYYDFYAGRIFGTLPFPLLKIHEGNELYYYDQTAFNMMNRYEYLSSEWAGFNLEHQLGGGIFNYIPGVRKLKLRQFWTAKGVVGKLSPENQALNFDHGFPFQTLEGKQYLELGTGIDNILHFFRVDFVWRVLPKSPAGEPLSERFGVFGSFRLKF